MKVHQAIWFVLVLGLNAWGQGLELPAGGTNYVSVEAVAGGRRAVCTDELALADGWTGVITWSNSINPGASNVLLIGRAPGTYTRHVAVGFTNQVNWPLPGPGPDRAVVVVQWSGDLRTWNNFMVWTDDLSVASRQWRVGIRRESEGSVP